MKSLASFLALIIIALPAHASPQAQTHVLSSSTDDITHVLNRLTFGARPGDVQKVRSMGVPAFIDAQLNPNSLAESPRVTAVLEKNSALRAPSSSLVAEFVQFRQQRKALQNGKGADAGATKQGQSRREMQRSPFIQEFGSGIGGSGVAGNGKNMRQLLETGAIETKLVRAVESPRQLNELMADFWFNHFNISMTKGLDRVLIGAYEEQAVRPYVFSNFRELLGATMHHPAMMFYLDNADNTKDGFVSPNPKNKKRGINENYARELLELHTLGVDGGYTQKDVTELARVLTGWGMPQIRGVASGGGYWASFDARRHDTGDKVVLGHTIKGNGAQEIEEVLDFLAKHPSTARHVSYQLAQYFVADKPPQALVDKLAARYLQTGGNTKSVLKTLFASSEFSDPQYRESKFKSPLRYTVSAIRATGMHADYPQVLSQFLKLQGQPMYACLTPDGYKNTSSTWLNPDGLLRRLDFAVKVANQQRRVSPGDYRVVLGTVNGGKLSERTQQALAKAPEDQRVAALIGSPEFMSY